MEVELKCIKCGSVEFAKPHPNHIFQDGEKVKCLVCGEVCDYSEIKRIAIEKALEEYVKANKQEIVKNSVPITDPNVIKSLNDKYKK